MMKWKFRVLREENHKVLRAFMTHPMQCQVIPGDYSQGFLHSAWKQASSFLQRLWAPGLAWLPWPPEAEAKEGGPCVAWGYPITTLLSNLEYHEQVSLSSFRDTKSKQAEFINQKDLLMGNLPILHVLSLVQYVARLSYTYSVMVKRMDLGVR